MLWPVFVVTRVKESIGMIPLICASSEWLFHSTILIVPLSTLYSTPDSFNRNHLVFQDLNKPTSPCLFKYPSNSTPSLDISSCDRKVNKQIYSLQVATIAKPGFMACWWSMPCIPGSRFTTPTRRAFVASGAQFGVWGFVVMQHFILFFPFNANTQWRRLYFFFLEVRNKSILFQIPEMKDRSEISDLCFQKLFFLFLLYWLDLSDCVRFSQSRFRLQLL